MAHDDSQRRLPNASTSGSAIEAPAPSTNHRARLLAELGQAIASATAAGDLEAARIAHEALARLLGPPGAAGGVVDLSAARARRGRP